MKLIKYLKGVFVIAVIAFMVFELVTFEPLHERDIVYFGSYEQDDILSNGSEPIEWIVMSVSESEAVLLSKYILDIGQPCWKSNPTKYSWEISDIREWLNIDFYETAFNIEERDCIKLTHNDILPDPVSENGIQTTSVDFVFLPSVENLVDFEMTDGFDFLWDLPKEDRLEVFNCFFNTELEGIHDYAERKIERRCSATKYAINKMAFLNLGEIIPNDELTVDNNRSFQWLLRSNVGGDKYINVVRANGRIGFSILDYDEYGVRPVIKVKLSGDFLKINKELSLTKHVPANIPSSNETYEIVADNYKSIENLKNLKIGKLVSFGKYEQDNDYSNGSEPIVWQILDNNDDGLLLLSKKIIDYREFADSNGYNWSDSSLRRWLNNDFYYNAFSDDERKIIKKRKSVINVPWNGTFLEETFDYCFLLNYEDIFNEKYGLNKEESFDIYKRATITPYVKSLIDEYTNNFMEEKKYVFCLTGMHLSGFHIIGGDRSYPYWLCFSYSFEDYKSHELTYEYLTISEQGQEYYIENPEYKRGIRPAILISYQ